MPAVAYGAPSLDRAAATAAAAPDGGRDRRERRRRDRRRAGQPERRERLRPGDAVHEQAVLLLEGPHGGARLRAVDAVRRDAQLLLQGHRRVRRRGGGGQRARAPAAAAAQPERAGGQRADDAVRHEAVRALVGLDRAARLRAEHAVGGDAEQPLGGGHGRAAAALLEQRHGGRGGRAWSSGPGRPGRRAPRASRRPARRRRGRSCPCGGPAGRPRPPRGGAASGPASGATARATPRSRTPGGSAKIAQASSRRSVVGEPSGRAEASGHPGNDRARTAVLMRFSCSCFRRSACEVS